MNRLPIFVLATAVAATAACSLTMGFDGFEGTTSSLEGADTGAASPDASGRTDLDVSTTGDLVEAGFVDVDAGDPNLPPVFVDGGSFCSTQESTAFCEDFDTADLPAHWLKEGIFARLTSTASKSTPNAFLLEAPETTAGGTFVSKITHALEAPSTNLVVSFDFQANKVNLGSSFLILAALEYTKNDTKYSIRLVYSSGSVRIEESNLVAPPNNKDEYHPFFDIGTDHWTRVKLDLVTAGATPGVQLSLDGTPVGTREALTPTPGMDPTPTLILGAVFAGNPHTGWMLRYDNLTVTYR